ncbi:unnamed protein product, partial [Didymodactylos carnosus]
MGLPSPNPARVRTEDDKILFSFRLATWVGGAYINGTAEM